MVDTGWDEEMRKSASDGADLVLLCCPVKELQTHDLSVVANSLGVFQEEAVKKENMVLVGTKSDVKDDGDLDLDLDLDLDARSGAAVAKVLGLQHFLECSSTSTSSVRELFKRAIEISNNTTGKSKPNTYSMYSKCLFPAEEEKEEVSTLESSQENLPPFRGLKLLNLVHSFDLFSH